MTLVQYLEGLPMNRVVEKDTPEIYISVNLFFVVATECC